MEYVIPSIALGVALIGGYTDIRTGKVYNMLTYPAMLLGMALHTLSQGWSGLLFSLQGIGVGIALLLLPYLLRVLGGGDVKLLAAMGSFFGPGDTFRIMVFGAIAGGVLAFFLLLKRRQLMSTLVNLAASPRVTLGLALEGKQDFPFAVTMPLGIVLLFVQRFLMGA